MKKQFVILFLITFLCMPVVSYAVAANSSFFAKNKIYMLYDKDCKKCDKEKDILEKNYKDDDNVSIQYININDNKELVKEIKKNLNINNDKLPITIIGTTYFTGFNNRVMNNITKAVNAYDKEDNYCDIVNSINNKDDIKKCFKDNKGIYKNNSTIIIIGIIAIAVVLFAIILWRRKNNHKK